VEKFPLQGGRVGTNLTPFSPADRTDFDEPFPSTGGDAHSTEGFANPCGERCAAALLRFSTNRSLAGRCAANFRGLFLPQVAALSNKKISIDTIFLSTR
jgi:hypothetical protein